MIGPRLDPAIPSSASPGSARGTGCTSTRRGRTVQLGADRRYTGPDCPPTCSSSAASRRATTRRCRGCCPRAAGRPGSRPTGPGAEFDLGDEVVLSARARRRAAARPPLRRDPPPPACAPSCARPGCRRCCPSGPTATGRAATSTSTSATSRPTGEGYREHDLPLDAIVIDSPWETQYNTWRVQPPPVPGRAGDDRGACASDGVRTVVWVDAVGQPRLASTGQRPPDAESERLHREPASNYAEGAEAGHYVAGADGEPLRRRAGGWAPARRSTSPRRGRARGGASRPKACCRSGVAGHQGRRRRGLLLPARRDASPTAAPAPRRPGGTGALYRETDAARARRGPRRRRGRPLRPLRLDRPAGRRDALGRRPGLGLLVAARAGRRDADRAASGFSNLSHDVGGYLGQRLVARCPNGAARPLGASSAASPR